MLHRFPSGPLSYCRAREAVILEEDEGPPDPYRLRAVGHSLGGAALLIYTVMSRRRKRRHHIYRLILLTPAGFLQHAPLVCSFTTLPAFWTIGDARASFVSGQLLIVSISFQGRLRRSECALHGMQAALPFIWILPFVVRLVNYWRPGSGAAVLIPSTWLRYITFKLTADLQSVRLLDR